jgi:hypothetical protein
MRNTGSPSGDRGVDQLATRERQAGPCGMAERLVVPMKVGNSSGGKGVVRQFVVPDMKRVSFCLAQALSLGLPADSSTCERCSHKT